MTGPGNYFWLIGVFPRCATHREGMTFLSAHRSASGRPVRRFRRAAAVALVGALAVAGCARFASVDTTSSPDPTTTVPVAAATTTAVPELSEPADLTQTEWAAWALPRLLGQAAVDDGDFAVDDVVDLLEAGSSRVDVALGLAASVEASRHTLSTAVSVALPVPREVAVAHAIGEWTTGEAMARIYASDAYSDMPRGAFELAWNTLSGESLTYEGWLGINSSVEHGLDPAADVYGWLTVGIDGEPGALEMPGSDVAVVDAALRDIDHLVDYGDIELLLELYRGTGSATIVRALVIAGALDAETVAEVVVVKLGPGGATVDAPEAPVPTTTAPPAAAPPAPAPATPVEGKPEVLLASDTPTTPKTWTADNRHWAWSTWQAWQAEVNRGGVLTTTTPEGFSWTGGHRDRGAGWILDVEMGDLVVVDGTTYKAVTEAWVKYGSADAYTDRIQALTGATTVLQTCGGSSMRLVGLEAVAS